MKVLVDTHCWLWWLSAPQKLNDAAKKLLGSLEHTFVFSVVSSLEIAIKHSLGKLALPEAPATLLPREIAAQGMLLLPVELAHALKVGKLPWHHKDPFDRLLVAQAQVEDLVILTADRRIRAYDVRTIWAGLPARPVASPRVPDRGSRVSSPRAPPPRRPRRGSRARSGRRSTPERCVAAGV